MTTDMTQADSLGDHARDLLNRIDQAWQTLTDLIASALNSFPEGIREDLVAAFNVCARKLSEALSQVKEVFEHAGSPTRVREAASAWTKDVGAPVTDAGGVLNLPQLAVDGSWIGPAAEKYTKVVIAQNSALDKVKIMTDDLQDGLENIASAMNTFWAIVVSLLVAFLADIIMAFALAVTVEAALCVPPLIGAGALVLLTGTLGAGAALDASLNQQRSAMEQISVDNSDFMGGHWPPGVSETAPDDWEAR